MSSRLEQFIKDHRDEFDSDEPSKKLWDNIRNQMEPSTAPRHGGSVVRFNFLRWSAAAAVLILLGSGLWYFTHRTKTNELPPVAVNEQPVKDNADSEKTVVTVPVDTASKQLAITEKPKKNEINEPKEQKSEPTVTDDMKEEMYHYTKLIEIKHKELKQIEKDEPLLYKQFSGDVHKLDSVYHSLQQQLPKNQNREQLLEAMIQNLQLQIQLLNHQLDIIKQINHSKKSAYEKAYQSV